MVTEVEYINNSKLECASVSMLGSCYLYCAEYANYNS